MQIVCVFNRISDNLLKYFFLNCRNSLELAYSVPTNTKNLNLLSVFVLLGMFRREQ